MSFLLYGAYGYTGELLAEEAKARGHHPVLAGRSEEKLRPLADRLDLPYVVLALDDEDRLAKAIVSFRAVVNAAGPFVHTAMPMMRACIAAGVHYTDVAGEIAVLESAFALDAQARDRGVTILPGIGFDVIPTDCLALHVARQVPGARQLEIAFSAGSRMSGGTARSTVLHMGEGGVVRRDGKLVPHPLGRGVRKVRFSDRERWVMPIPWGDLATAFRTTGIPDITVSTVVPAPVAHLLRWTWPLAARTRPLLASGLGQRLATRLAVPADRGPGEEERRDRRSVIWARASDGVARHAEAWLETLDGYSLTKVLGIRAVERLIAGDAPEGTTTPALAFGPDFVLEAPRTRRLDALPTSEPQGEPT